MSQSSTQNKVIPHNKMSSCEIEQVKKVLLSTEYVDQNPREIFFKLLDENKTYLASPSTFYQVSREMKLNNPRKNYKLDQKLKREKPVLQATRPNQLWSWDVSYIQRDVRGEYYYLYVIMDIWSRFIVGYSVELTESTDHAIHLIEKALDDQGISGEDLINHKDNGSIMRSQEMLNFVKNRRMIDSYSRPGRSNDNPFSESLFGTMKTNKDYPESFLSIEEARKYFQKNVYEYNFVNLHSSINFIPPCIRHYREEEKVFKSRQKVMLEFYEKNLHRFNRRPQKMISQKVVGINLTAA